MIGLLLTGFILALAPAQTDGGVHASGLVRAEELKTAVRTFLEERVSGGGVSIDVVFRSVPDSVRVARLPYALHVLAGGSGRCRGPVTVVIEIQDGSGVVQRRMVTGVVRTYADVVIAERMLPRHATPERADLRCVRMETTMIGRPLVSDPADVASSRTKRIVQKGGILYADMFEPVPLVLQGDKVVVKVQSGSVLLKTEGIAREDGHRGEMIEVYLRGRSERIFARVESARTLTVPLD